MDMHRELEACRALIEARLGEKFTAPGLEEAMRYSLLAGGKRIRPILTVKFCEAAGGQPEAALDAACGVEMLHTYSLIHDDLPCMDNDDLRRGRPTCHKVYGECVATLAGDALQAAAFEAVLGSAHVPGEARARMGLVLARAAGSAGMCYGQYLDMKAEGTQPTPPELTAIHTHKTADLLQAACQMGVLCAPAGENTEVLLAAAAEYARHLGLAFQIRDDILDETATTQALGKPAGSDAANGKHTFASLLGVEECERLVEKHTGLAKAALAAVLPEERFLPALADALARRDH